MIGGDALDGGGGKWKVNNVGLEDIVDVGRSVDIEVKDWLWEG